MEEVGMGCRNKLAAVVVYFSLQDTGATSALPVGRLQRRRRRGRTHSVHHSQLETRQTLSLGQSRLPTRHPDSLLLG